MSERWVLEILALALALVLVVAASVYGLALVSTWAPAGPSLAAGQPVPISYDTEASPIEPTRYEEGI